ncbi:hypothetical protein E1200_31840 [Actinomadura sp. GC306]|uniref:hypothetical protein n=1 Tax=Actinomadura sp. GC306 TaxID=2530367 RepID=UPI00104ADBD0|nr:hypothetical protein [Actinomadura sp. GC306]TDC59596.1 hypothetical protein E1200_31840 [Actinomadura sp. GC306]
MEPAAIHRGAKHRPQGRPRHAVVLVLVRVIAVAGFAVAGWLAMAALTDVASAAQSGPRGDVGRVQQEAAPVEAGVRPVLGAVRAEGDRRLRSLGAERQDVSRVPDRVRDFGDDPVRFLQERRHEVLDGKDRAVRQVRELADAVGVPRVELTRTGVAPVRPGVLLAPEAGHGDAGVRPELPDGEPQAERVSVAEAGGEEPSGGIARSVPRVAPTAYEAPDDCAGCLGDRQPADPALPSGQENPPGAGSGGPTYTPVAALLRVRHPAVPPAGTPDTFHRTALTDVSAPGGPSVVPD